MAAPNLVQFKNHISLALTHLKKSDYGAYITALAAIGADLSQELNIESVKDIQTKNVKLAIQPAELSEAMPANWNAEEDLEDARIKASVFASGWGRDKETNADDKTHTNNQQNQLAYKIKLERSKSTRRLIHLGMIAVENALNYQAETLEAKKAAILEANKEEEGGADKDKNIVPDTDASQIIPASVPSKGRVKKLADLANIDNGMKEALQNFTTRREVIAQTTMNYISKFTTVGTAFAWGFIEGAVAVFFFGLLFTPIGWPLYLLFSVAILAGCISTYVNYCSLKFDIPGVLKKIAGKDSLLQGFLTYKDETTGETKQFSKNQKYAMLIFSLALALPTGIAIGALGYTSTISIPTILTLVFGISVGSAFFPPIGIAVAIIVVIGSAGFFIANFHSFLVKTNESYLDYITKPFKEVIGMINKYLPIDTNPTANKVAKVIAVGLTGLLSVLAIFGLSVAAIAGVNSLTAFVGNVFMVSSTAAATVGIAVGGVISFSSRVFTTVNKCFGAIVNLCKLAFKEPTPPLDKTGLKFLPIEIIMEWFFYEDAMSRPQADPVIPFPTGDVYSGGAATLTSVRTTGMYFVGMFQEENPATAKAPQQQPQNDASGVTPAGQPPQAESQGASQSQPSDVAPQATAAADTVQPTEEQKTRLSPMVGRDFTKEPLANKYSLFSGVNAVGTGSMPNTIGVKYLKT